MTWIGTNISYSHQHLFYFSKLLTFYLSAVYKLRINNYQKTVLWKNWAYEMTLKFQDLQKYTHDFRVNFLC